METLKRSLAKSISYRICGTGVTFVVAWGITGQLALAGVIGVFDSGVKLFAYVLHERAWNHISFGRSKPPEYLI